VPLSQNAERIGFLILEIAPDSPAARASLLPGDVLVGASSRPFRSADDLEAALHSSRNAALEIEFRRGGSDQIRKVVTQVLVDAVRAA
jgi:serine protease Do